MDFRCVSFHQANPDLDLCRLAAGLGFNHVELQTENPQFRKELKLAPGEPVRQLDGLRACRERLTRQGKLQPLRGLGLRVVLWTREIEDHDPDRDGPLSSDNPRLYAALAQRYARLFTEVFPEAQAVAMTVAESSTWIDDPRVIARVCETVAQVCREHGRTLIVRSFAYESQRAAVGRVLRSLPDDVLLMTKYNPRDWHLRGIRDPRIGNLAPGREIVEEDIAGEYHLENRVANCMADAFRDRFLPLRRMGLHGLTLRCNRGWDMARNHQGSLYGEVQESHLWAYAAWMRESLEGEAARSTPIHRWAASVFGDDAPLDELVEVFRPTGGAVAEALYVGPEPFGDARSRVPIVRTTGGDWGWQTTPVIPARRYTDEEAERCGDHDGAAGGIPWGRASAFHHGRSNHPEDPAWLASYHRLRRGHPRCVADKAHALTEARATMDRSIARFDALRDRVPGEPWAYLRFKLERTRRELVFRGHAAMAYLLGCQRLYSDDPAARRKAGAQIATHLRAITAMVQNAQTRQTVAQSHRGRTFDFPPWPEGMAAFVNNLEAHFRLE